MAFLEEHIAILEKRIEKIKAKPDPSRLKSNLMLYELERDHHKYMLEHFYDRPFMDGGTLITVPRSMGFEMLSLAQTADRLASDSVAAYMERVRQLGYGDYACDRTVTMVPMVMDGKDLPKPAMLVDLYSACEIVSMSYNALARELNIPIFTMETRSEATDHETIKYLTEQVYEFIDFAEKHVPGVKYNEEKLIELQAIERQWYAAMYDLYVLRRRVPCPIGGRDAFREPRWASLYYDPKRALDYALTYRDEVAELADKGSSPVKEEKLRFMWMISGPFYYNPFKFLEEHGVSVPYWMYGEGARISGAAMYGSYGDVVEFNRKFDPIEEQARMMSANSWGGPSKRWIDDTLFIGRDLKIDGFVWFQQVSCMPVAGMERLFAERAEKELGAPVLFIEGRQAYNAGFDPRVMDSKLETFIQLCLDRKGIK